MNALALMATLGLDTSNYEKGLKGAGGMAQSFASSFKKVLGGVAIAGGAAVTAAGATVVSVVKSAVTAYKEFEQLEGGAALIFGKKGSFEEFASGASESLYQMGQRGEDVKQLQEEINALLGDGEKLAVDGIYGPKTQAALDQYAGKLSSVQKSYETQGSAYDFMMGRADEAYKNVQMSASEYIAQVVGLGAGLKQSLGGDAQAAAELADKIITAEADVVAATGRPMEAVQNAFNGLLRGNYSMLDNLGIGIKASKTGMEEVIQKVNEWNKANGKATKYRMGNLADEQAALVDYIEMVGYAGYAEREALDTLEGSFAATKASWKDMLVEFGRGGDIKKAMGKLVTAGKAAVTNLIPVVKNALSSVGTFVGEVAPVIAQELPGIISEAGPAFLQAVGSLAGSLVTNFPAMLSGLGSAVAEAITGDPNADFSAVAGAIINGIKANGSVLAANLRIALGLTENASWGEVAGAIIKGVKDQAASLSGEVKKAIVGDENASWGDVAGAIGKGIRANASTLAANLRVALGITEGADWSMVGTNIKKGIEGAFTTGSEFLKGLLGVGDGESIGASLGGAIITGINGAFEGVSGLVAGVLFGDGESGIVQEAEAIEGALKGVATALLSIKIIGAVSTIPATFAKIAASVSNLTGSFATLGTGIGIVAGLAVTLYNVSDGFRGAVDSMTESVKLFWEGLSNPEKFAENWEHQQETAIERLHDGEEQVFGHRLGENTAPMYDNLLPVPGLEEANKGVDDYSNKLEKTQETIDQLMQAAEQLGEGEPITIPVALDDTEYSEAIAELQKISEEAGLQAEEQSSEQIENTKQQIEELKTFLETLGLENVDETISKLENAVAEDTGADVSAMIAEIEAAAMEGYDALQKKMTDAAEESKTTVSGAVESGVTEGAQAGGEAAKGVVESAMSGITIDVAINPIIPDLTPDFSKGYVLAGKKQNNARAMANGRIFNRPTIFGYADGAYQVAGDAGPEAVVGVSSLRDMIRDAVGDQLGAIINGMGAIQAGQNQGDLQVVLDSGVLVGQMARGMDRQMGKLATWRGGGRA